MSGDYPEEAVDEAISCLKLLMSRAMSTDFADDIEFGRNLFSASPEVLVDGARSDPQMHRLLLRLIAEEAHDGRALPPCIDRWYADYLSGAETAPSRAGGRPTTFPGDAVLAITAQHIAEQFGISVYRSEASDPHCSCDVVATALSQIEGKEQTYEQVREKVYRVLKQMKTARGHPLVQYLREIW